MEKTTLLSLLFLFLFLVSPLTSSAFILNDRRLVQQAQTLIRELNLFPKEDVNVIDDREGFSILDDAEGSRIVEKKLRFPNLVGDSDVSVEDLGHHAGYYKLQNSRGARMFYFFFESRYKKDDPVVIWLTGGPGCSSELALFYENGPFKVSDNMSLLWNEYGWDKVSNLLYVDQPVGTGFSYTTDKRDLRHDEDGVSNDLYDFIQVFFAKHPDFVKNDFYITGESYAGHYIPAFATRVHRGNKAKDGIHINLKGFAIGNGMTDPAIQYAAYPDFALEMGLITKPQKDLINKIVPLCQAALKLCGTDGKASCLASLFVCETIFSSIELHMGDLNYYDVRKKCVGSLCYDFSNMEKFLNLKSVRESLGVGDINFVSCSQIVYLAMLMDCMRNLEVGIPSLLGDGVKLLVYAGEYDLICNWLGNWRWVHAMEWSGKKEFGESPEVPFTVDGSEAGVLKSYGPLGFLKVRDAGHMVPMDQPKAALEMLRRWMDNSLSAGGLDSATLVAQM